MAAENTDPIIIGSDDESDNDDVVLIKEEIEVDSEDCIFLSETKPTPKSDVFLSETKPTPKSDVFLSETKPTPKLDVVICTSLPGEVSGSSHDTLTSFSSSASLTSCTAQISLEDKFTGDVLASIIRDSSSTSVGPLDLSSKSSGVDDSQSDPVCPRTNDNATSDVSQNSSQDSSFLMLLTGSMDLQQTGNKSDKKPDTSGIATFKISDKNAACDKASVSDISNNCDINTTISNPTTGTDNVGNPVKYPAPDWSTIKNILTMSQGTTSTNQDQDNNSNGQNVTKSDTLQQKDVHSDRSQFAFISNLSDAVPTSTSTSTCSTIVPTTQTTDQTNTATCTNSTSDLTDPFKASHALLSSMDLSLNSNSQPHSDLVSASKNSQSNLSLQSSYPSSSTTLYNSLTLPLSQLNAGQLNRQLKRSVSTNDAYNLPSVFKSSFKDQASASPRSPSPQSSHHLPPKKQRRCYSSSSRDFTCINCDVNVAGEKYPRCPNGHATCKKCLEERVKLVLTGRAKESVKCLSKSCDSYYPISELRRSLPAMVVEILEDKLDLEYVKYISDMIVKEAAEDMEQETTATVEAAQGFEYDERSEMKYIRKYEDCPSHWDSMDEREVNKKGYVLVQLEPGTQEHGDVVARFFDSMVDHNVECTSVYRVQNPIQHKYYTVKRAEMVRDSEGFHSVLEGKLFHGTSSSTVDAICRKGFDWRLCGKHGTMYGQGSYFAMNASYSHQYTDLRRPPGTLRSSMTFNQPMSMTLPTTPSLLFPPVNVNFGQPLVPLGLNQPSHIRPMNLSHGAPVVSQPMNIGMTHSQTGSQASQVFSNSGNQSNSSQFGSSSAGSVQPGPSSTPGTSAMTMTSSCLKFIQSKKIDAISKKMYVV